MNLDQRKRKQYLMYLQKLCDTFEVLPSSFTLPPTSVKRETTHFASGDYSNAYRATFSGRPVVIKIPNVAPRADQEKLHMVNGFDPRCQSDSLHTPVAPR